MTIPAVFFGITLGVLLFLGIRMRARSASRDAEELKTVIKGWLEEKSSGTDIEEKAMRFKAIWTTLLKRINASARNEASSSAAPGVLEKLFEDSRVQYGNLQKGLAEMGEKSRARRIAEMVTDFQQQRG